jgi:hypothetical protein
MFRSQGKERLNARAIAQAQYDELHGLGLQNSL